MKVICINNKVRNPYLKNEWLEYLKEGEEYIVEMIVDGTYKIKGIDHPIIPNRPTFSTSRFIPLSEINEEEFERDYNAIKSNLIPSGLAIDK